MSKPRRSRRRQRQPPPEERRSIRVLIHGIQALQQGRPVPRDLMNILDNVHAYVLRGAPVGRVAEHVTKWLGLTTRAITDLQNEQQGLQLEFAFMLERAQDPRLKSTMPPKRSEAAKHGPLISAWRKRGANPEDCTLKPLVAQDFSVHAQSSSS
jgi:hypothetical protein